VSNRPHHLPTLGEVIRRQRELAELPMRRLADMVGISNPYLSQIERGLRAPSEQVLQAIAAALRTSADALVDLATRDAAAAPARPPVIAAIEQDTGLTARQRQALAEVYTAMIEATAGRRRRGRGDSTPEPSGGG
jgi:transcriptional regulator with XRE-family HTH domain